MMEIAHQLKVVTKRWAHVYIPHRYVVEKLAALSGQGKVLRLSYRQQQLSGASAPNNSVDSRFVHCSHLLVLF